MQQFKPIAALGILNDLRSTDTQVDWRMLTGAEHEAAVKLAVYLRPTEAVYVFQLVVSGAPWNVFMVHSVRPFSLNTQYFAVTGEPESSVFIEDEDIPEHISRN